MRPLTIVDLALMILPTVERRILFEQMLIKSLEEREKKAVGRREGDADDPEGQDQRRVYGVGARERRVPLLLRHPVH